MTMKPNLKKIAALLILAGALVVALSGAALAGPPWSDASATWWVNTYGVTEAQVATVADGFPDGTFKPSQAVTRGQFAKMAVSGFEVPTANPATATFKDVIPSHRFYTYIEGAYKKELIGGYPSSGGLLYFKPDSKITRQQANSIIGRYLSQVEIDITGSIHGVVNTYGTLDLWFAAEGPFYLNQFDDASKVAASHRATTAYLVYRKIVEGSNNKLNPASTLLRSQAAALILRIKAEVADIKTPPGAPTNLGVTATDVGQVVTYDTVMQRYVGNDPTPQVTGDTLAGRPLAVYDTVSGATTKLVEDSSNAAGKFYTDVPSALTDGTHSFTARVKNANGLVSAPSAPVSYLLDTVQPGGMITQPVVPSGSQSAALTSNKPVFTANATDGGSGVKQVAFQAASKAAATSWQTISTDTAPEPGTTTYAAVWPTTGPLSAGLTEGQYLLRVVITDNVGNERIPATVDVTLDVTQPTVQMTSPVAAGIFYTESGMPTFTATAADPAGASLPASGISSVQFYYAPKASSPTTWAGFTLISIDTSAPYEASYSTGALSEGHYIFAVKAVDAVGKESALMNTSGTGYAGGVTQEVVIDATAPTLSVVVSGTELVNGRVQESKPLTVVWTLADLTPPSKVKIEYTLNGSVAAPQWQEIPGGNAAATSPTGGSFSWVAPDVAGDMQFVQVRVTAIDRAGELLSPTDIPGHTAYAKSSYFTVYDFPLPPTGLVGSNTADANPGIDGRDIRADWTPSVSTDIRWQELYILPADVLAIDVLLHHSRWKSSEWDNATDSWTGDASITTDSTGALLAAGAYRLWMVVTDAGGLTRVAGPSEAFTVTAD